MQFPAGERTALLLSEEAGSDSQGLMIPGCQQEASASSGGGSALQASLMLFWTVSQVFPPQVQREALERPERLDAPVHREVF